jgi:hypothetical protein
VVGYVNLSLTNGYNLIANQLDLDGSLTNNTLYSVLGTNLPNNTKTWTYVAGNYSSVTFATSTGKWVGTAAQTNTANAALTPGQGLFVQIPPSASYPQTVTLVGQVLQGTNVQPIIAGYQCISSMFPLSGSFTNIASGYNAANNDKLWTWNTASQGYTSKTYASSTASWVGGAPSYNVGQAFFLQARLATNWVQSFVIPN